MNRSSSFYLSIFYTVASASCMATIGTFARFVKLSAGEVTFYRLFIAAVCLTFYMLLSGQGKEIIHMPSRRTIINGIMLAGFMVFYIHAINNTTMAMTVMFVYLSPLICSVFAHFFFGERLSLTALFCIIMAVVGFSMMLQFSFNIEGVKNSSLGLIYASLSTLTYSAFLLVNRRPGRTSPYQSTLVQLLVGAICVLPFLLQSPSFPSLSQFKWLLAIGLIPGFFGILLAVKALRSLPTVIFGTVAYIETVVVVVLGWFIFSETLTPLQICGALLIVVAGIIQGTYHLRR